jgi:hypothetical protein
MPLIDGEGLDGRWEQGDLRRAKSSCGMRLGRLFLRKCTKSLFIPLEKCNFAANIPSKKCKPLRIIIGIEFLSSNNQWLENV